MSEIKRSWDLLTKEQRAGIIRETISYFKNEQEQEIGMIAAEEILDFFLQALGKEIFNRAIYESKGVVKQALEDLEVDLDILQKK